LFQCLLVVGTVGFGIACNLPVTYLGFDVEQYTCNAIISLDYFTKGEPELFPRIIKFVLLVKKIKKE